MEPKLQMIIRVKTQNRALFLERVFAIIDRGVWARLHWRVLQRRGLVTVGKHTYGSPLVHSWNDQTKLKIGKYCSIAEGVVFILGGEHRTDWITTFPLNSIFENQPSFRPVEGHPATKGDISVGNDVWIGYGAVILSGVTVGDGAVIGAGSVVTKNVDDYAIVAGSPAKFVKYRFDESTRESLQRSSWWDWPDEKVFRNLNRLLSSPIGSNLTFDN